MPGPNCVYSSYGGGRAGRWLFCPRLQPPVMNPEQTYESPASGSSGLSPCRKELSAQCLRGSFKSHRAPLLERASGLAHDASEQASSNSWVTPQGKCISNYFSTRESKRTLAVSFGH